MNWQDYIVSDQEILLGKPTIKGTRLSVEHIVGLLAQGWNEDKILNEILTYIKGTYGQHYSTGKDGFQIQDLFKTLNIGKDFCHANAIKYLCRYGKKNGYNRADLLKAVHYVILLLNYDKENVKWT